MNKSKTVPNPEKPTTRKRKSDEYAPASKPGPAKQIRRATIHNFFSPQVPAGNDKEKEDQYVGLNKEQNDVLRMVVEEGKNVFFTGSAGTGKSLLLRAIISFLRRKYSNKPDIVAITASTGMAASNIGGMTIHAWGAVAPNSNNIDNLVSYIRKCKPALQRWKTAKVLVIDEVSMVDGHLLDRLAAIAAKLRKSDRPFGGIQVVVTGDFFQLPPVCKTGEDPFFAFESSAWSTCIEHTVVLTHVYRQKDSTFVDLLNSMRKGTIPPSALSIFTSLSRTLPPLPHAPKLLPTELFPLRHEVARANSARLAALRTTLKAFKARDSGSADPEKRTKLLENVGVGETVEVKRGAQVMLVKNIGNGLVNGSVGVVIGFYRVTDVFGVGTGSDGDDKGVALRNVRMDPDGRPIVRPQSENKENVNVSVKPESKTSVKPPSNSKGKTADSEPYPLVEFAMPQGSKEVVLVMRDEFRVEDSEGKVLARRVQVPLMLAWAMSIHKSQGQTIERVKIDLGKVFEKGQSYVALSRAASLEGLQVLRFDPRKVMAHPKVVKWSRKLEEEQNQPSTDS